MFSCQNVFWFCFPEYILIYLIFVLMTWETTPYSQPISVRCLLATSSVEMSSGKPELTWYAAKTLEICEQYLFQIVDEFAIFGMRNLFSSLFMSLDPVSLVYGHTILTNILRLAAQLKLIISTVTLHLSLEDRKLHLYWSYKCLPLCLKGSFW